MRLVDFTKIKKCYHFYKNDKSHESHMYFARVSWHRLRVLGETQNIDSYDSCDYKLVVAPTMLKTPTMQCVVLGTGSLLRLQCYLLLAPVSLEDHTMRCWDL